MHTVLKYLALSVLVPAAISCATGGTVIPIPARKTPGGAYPSIVIYSVSWCPHCKEAGKYLSDKKIPFINLDVEKDENAREIFRKKYRATAVPLIIIGDDEAILRGFSSEALEKALAGVKQ